MEPTVSQSVEVPVDPAAAFRLYTAEINRWWKRDSWYWNDRERARGLRIEPFVGGRFVEVYDEATGEGFEIGRVTVWEPGRRVAYTWRQADWPPGEEMEIEVTFAPAAGGTLVTINVRGWERLTGGAEIGRGYGEGAEVLGAAAVLGERRVGSDPDRQERDLPRDVLLGVLRADRREQIGLRAVRVGHARARHRILWRGDSGA